MKRGKANKYEKIDDIYNDKYFVIEENGKQKVINSKEEIIISGLREAVFSGVNNFRYIDKILSEWSKKGIDSIDKVEKNKKEYKKTTQKVLNSRLYF